MRKLILPAILIALSFCSCAEKKTELASPDGKIVLHFDVDGQGRMTYDVAVNDSAFILPSDMGLLSRNGVNLNEGFKVVDVDFASADETWSQPWGENKTIRNRYNEMAVSLDNEEGTQLVVRFRLFDDGLGFRYEYEVPGADSLFVMDENTAFRFAGDAAHIRADG